MAQCKKLVLDAGPLLSLSPLRGLADTFLTVPQVLAELKDARAREHFEKLGLLSGVNVEIRSPDTASLSEVIRWAKKTGDYSVLSFADLCVLALTYSLDQEDKMGKGKTAEITDTTTFGNESSELYSTLSIENISDKLEQIVITNSDEVVVGAASVSLNNTVNIINNRDQIPESDLESPNKALPNTNEEALELEEIFSRSSPSPIYDDPSDSDDGEGEWITPANVATHKALAMDLLPNNKQESKGRTQGPISSGCMTADFAMQNVLLQIGLNLVSSEGNRIEKIKTWVLRCHACFKICKDNSKKFCPSCGNPTLLRASVTVAAPGASPDSLAMQVHLKPNFQYKTRGTIYSVPAPKPGSAKTGPGTGLILREDQVEYLRAKKQAEGKRRKEESKLLKGILAQGVENGGYNARTSSWMDPDWVPGIISGRSNGYGRKMTNSKMDGDMLQIGYGRKNPNEKRRKR